MKMFVKRWLLSLCAVSTVWANPIQTREADYVMPSPAGFRMQHGFETGFEDGKAHGLESDTRFNGNRTVVIRNGKIPMVGNGCGRVPGCPDGAVELQHRHAEYRELYVRWLQWATLLPFMRTLGSRKCNVQNAHTCNNEGWSYGEENTPMIVSYIQLRYQLKAYLQALFEQIHHTYDAAVTCLACGCLSSGDDTQCTEWEVYLPQKGQSETKPWTYRWTNETYAGGLTVTVPAPIEHVPLFYLGKREDIMSGCVF
ncbi:hypothetical protein KXV22_006687 [Aspergillus fumigatus]|nr:hypothetical protein KXX45_005819 [Aspergillus fumigatus]KAH1287085.1 hypothetical protein KXX48_009391 [Aspergillus fumigatus]KAH1392186.1 hypothetical protein KXX49_001845 [Aspergillus fumigatus]KAH1719624.1 hypothetical protein KXX60_000544 [Aspergillus fumigatus]KAH1754808.1 hypothetical protein KXX41_007372 [Aspergillus fumigatus]